MKVAVSLASLVALAGLACSAAAQDSISNHGTGLPGDALDPWGNAANQVATYGVDLVPLFTSCDYRFGIAPLVKASRTSAAHFSSLFSAQGLSQTLLTNLPATARATYSDWFFSPGAGVSPVDNFAGASVTPVSWTPYGFNQFGAVMSEFSTDQGGASNNNIISAVVNYAPERPQRMWVTRVVAAVNEHANGNGKNAAFGAGSIDAEGHVYFRADGNTSTGPNPLSSTQTTLLRVRTLGRSAASINSISALAPTDAAATDLVLNASTVTHNPPTCVPSELSGLADGRLLSSNFNKEYVYESAHNVTTATTAHRTGAADHRGCVTFSQVNLFGGNSVGTAAMIGKSTTPAGDPADRVCVWGVNGNGSVGSQFTLAVPNNMSDTCDGYNFVADGWDNYHSQTAFNGGNGQIAVGKDQAGRGLLCGFVTSNRTSAVNPWDALAVCRFDPTNPVGTAQWCLAAWTDTPNTLGKNIRGDYGADGAPFTGDLGEFDGVCDANDAPIGRMASFSELGITGLVGPSISSPAFDSVGNIWFIASVALKKFDSVNHVYFTDYDSALLRANYDPQNFCYTLEKVLELGQTFQGNNSGTNWQIQYMEIVDNNSVASGTVFSQNAMQGAWNNLDPTGFSGTMDTRALGGLVLGAKIVYDVDGDGDFEDPTSTGGNPASLDEAYDVLLYIGNTSHGCPADFNGDGFVTGDDADQFGFAFFWGDPAADFNGDGFTNGDDADAFAAAFDAGC